MHGPPVQKQQLEVPNGSEWFRMVLSCTPDALRNLLTFVHKPMLFEICIYLVPGTLQGESPRSKTDRSKLLRSLP